MFRFPVFTVLDPLAGYLVFPFLEAASKGLARICFRNPPPVCTENLIQVDDVTESPKLAE
jgi:hypothetical protein